MWAHTRRRRSGQSCTRSPNLRRITAAARSGLYVLAASEWLLNREPQEQEVLQVSAEDVAAQQALAAAVRERQVEYDAAQRLVELGREEQADYKDGES